MSNFQETANWLKACDKLPGDGAALAVQMGCDIEEQLELLKCFSFTMNEHEYALFHHAIHSMEELATRLKTGDCEVKLAPEDRIEALDAICDREVTGNGLAYLLGFDKDGADKAVIASNWAKLVDGKPVLKPGGKIAKPEGWTAPDLTPFI